MQIWFLSPLSESTPTATNYGNLAKILRKLGNASQAWQDAWKNLLVATFGKILPRTWQAYHVKSLISWRHNRNKKVNFVSKCVTSEILVSSAPRIEMLGHQEGWNKIMVGFARSLIALVWSCMIMLALLRSCQEVTTTLLSTEKKMGSLRVWPLWLLMPLPQIEQ